MTVVKQVVSRSEGRHGKVRKEFWLDPKALRRAQSILKTPTERETVERALDMIAFGAEVQIGVAALAGLQLGRRSWVRKYVLDTNCYIDASRNAADLAALQDFSGRTAPGLYVSSVVVSELLAGARSVKDRKVLEDRVLGPFLRHGRVLTPSAAAWDALARTMAYLHQREGLHLAQISRAFAFDILLAYSCKEHGVVLVTANERDMVRIRRVFAFDYVAPYPVPA
jgi:predicted nucleic acid-binding protein